MAIFWWHFAVCLLHSPGTFPVSIDMVGLYNNIPNDEGLAEFGKALVSRKDKSISTDFLVELLELVLTLNISEFDKKTVSTINWYSYGYRCRTYLYKHFYGCSGQMVRRMCSIQIQRWFHQKFHHLSKTVHWWLFDILD